jgi:subtilisin-like proprotein convertase family protein
MAPIPDDESGGVSSTISIGKSGVVTQIKVMVDIQHTYIGDLRVTLISPAGRTTVLHPQLGGSSDDLIATYDSSVPGELGGMVGQPMKGTWTLNVSDRSKIDTGKLRGWSLEFRSNVAGPVLVAGISPSR